MRRVVIATSLSLILVVAACGSDGGKSSTDAGSTTTSSTLASADSSTSSTSAGGGSTSNSVPPSCRPDGATSMQSNELSGVDQLLSSVTTSSTECTDSITFTFLPNAAPRPSYVIEYVDGPFTDSAGREIKPPGTSYLKVRFQPAWIADLNQPAAPLTYTGPRVITPVGSSVVRGLALYDASEAVVGWVVGVDGTHPFTVEASPSNVVITVSRA